MENGPRYLHAKLFTVFLALLFLLASAGSSIAQIVDSDWSAPIQLSSLNSDSDSVSMVSDSYGSVYVFLSEQSLADDLYSIMYSRFDGEYWSVPLDIHLASKPTNMIRSVSAAIDQQDVLHLVWIEGNSGPVYYSHSPIKDAGSARNWSSPIPQEIPAFEVNLKVDSKGVLHLAYLDFYGERPGVYYTRSVDHAQTWTSPIWLDPDRPRDYRPIKLDFDIGKNDQLHLMWAYIDLTTEDSGIKWLRYSQSQDGGQTWAFPYTIAREDDEEGEVRAAAPLMAVYGDIVHSIWPGDAKTRREYRMSSDGGLNWSEPIRIFGDLHGAAGDTLVVDVDGIPHFLGQIRWPQGIYHSQWSDNRWTTPSIIYLVKQSSSEPYGDRIHAHNVQMAVSSYNDLVATFTNSPEESELILYATHRTNKDTLLNPIATHPTTQAQDNISILDTEPVSNSRVTSTVSPHDASGESPLSTTLSDRTIDIEPEANPMAGSNLLLGIGPVLLLLGFTVTFLVLRNKILSH